MSEETGSGERPAIPEGYEYVETTIKLRGGKEKKIGYFHRINPDGTPAALSEEFQIIEPQPRAGVTEESEFWMTVAEGATPAERVNHLLGKAEQAAGKERLELLGAAAAHLAQHSQEMPSDAVRAALERIEQGLPELGLSDE